MKTWLMKIQVPGLSAVRVMAQRGHFEKDAGEIRPVFFQEGDGAPVHVRLDEKWPEGTGAADFEAEFVVGLFRHLGKLADRFFEVLGVFFDEVNVEGRAVAGEDLPVSVIN